MKPRRVRGVVLPLSTEPARCYPSLSDSACDGCARHRSGDPAPAEVRREPIIDASLFRRDGLCQMLPTASAAALGVAA